MRNKMLTTQQLESNRRRQESNRPFMNVPKDQTSSHQNLLKVLPPTNSTWAGNQALPHRPLEDIYAKPISQHWKKCSLETSELSLSSGHFLEHPLPDLEGKTTSICPSLDGGRGSTCPTSAWVILYHLSLPSTADWATCLLPKENRLSCQM